MNLPTRTRMSLLALAPTVAAVTATAWRFTPTVRRMVDAGDFPAHIEFAQDIAVRHILPVPHFFYHLVLIAAHAVAGGSWAAASVAATVGGLMVTAMLIARWIREAVPGSLPLQLTLSVVLPLVLLTAQPTLPFGQLVRDPWLIGYWPPNQWHNPTILFSKPLALALFPLGLAATVDRLGFSWRRILVTALLVVASALTKPNFLIAFLPTVGVAALMNQRRADWRLVFFGFGIPTALVFAPQFLLRYRLQTELGLSVGWAPLYVVGMYMPTDIVSLASRFVASVLFPLAATLLFLPAAIRDRFLLLAWGTFLVGTATGYLLTEHGGIASHGNFLWSGQLGAFLLFVVAAIFVVRVAARADRLSSGLLGRLALVALLLAWHVESGIRHLQTSWFD